MAPSDISQPCSRRGRNRPVLRARIERACQCWCVQLNSRAFTLIEASVVLIIIGLIIGGIVIAKAMIRSSQLQGVITDVARYTQAVSDFRDKYLALPGDFTGAEALWGSDVSCPNTPYPATPHRATCNGDGNGQIFNYGNVATTYEIYRSVQQLADSGMIDGTYTGVAGPAGFQDGVPGMNVPNGSLPGSGYLLESLLNADAIDFGGNFYPGPYLHAIIYGSPFVGDAPRAPLFTGAEALGLDQKMDDGLPASGNIMSFKHGGTFTPNCATAAAKYNKSDSKLACVLLFKAGY
jgi:type II secretory pathway pseudopilin PulG